MSPNLNRKLGKIININDCNFAQIQYWNNDTYIIETILNKYMKPLQMFVCIYIYWQGRATQGNVEKWKPKQN